MIVCDWVNKTYSRKVCLPFILFCFLRLRHGRYRLFLYWHLVAAALLCAPQFCLFSTSCVVFFPLPFAVNVVPTVTWKNKQTIKLLIDQSVTRQGVLDQTLSLSAELNVTVYSWCKGSRSSCLITLFKPKTGSQWKCSPEPAPGWMMSGTAQALQRKAGFNKPGCGLHWDSLGHMLANSFTSCICSFVFR